MPGPAPECPVKTIHLGIPQLPSNALTGKPSFFELQRATMPTNVIENALVVRPIGTQPAAQCGGADM